MNCKPGDLARIIANSPIVLGLTRDALVTVHAWPPVNRKGFCPAPDGTEVRYAADSWLVEFMSPVIMRRLSGDYLPTKWVACRDSMLRPIRDPGDDAQDETLEWLPVPSKATETA